MSIMFFIVPAVALLIYVIDSCLISIVRHHNEKDITKTCSLEDYNNEEEVKIPEFFERFGPPLLIGTVLVLIGMTIGCDVQRKIDNNRLNSVGIERIKSHRNSSSNLYEIVWKDKEVK